MTRKADIKASRAARKTFKEVRQIRIEASGNFFAVVGKITVKSTQHEVRSFLTPETILTLADAIRKCPRAYKQGLAIQLSHAFWHVDNPDAPPCT